MVQKDRGSEGWEDLFVKNGKKSGGCETGGWSEKCLLVVDKVIPLTPKSSLKVGGEERDGRVQTRVQNQVKHDDIFFYGL